VPEKPLHDPGSGEGLAERGDGDPLERGRRAYAARAWAQAYEALLLADREGTLDVEDLERLGWTAAFTGREDESVAFQGRAYEAHLAANQLERAALLAFWIGFRLANKVKSSAASGWLARAQRLVEASPQPTVAAGYLLLPEVRKRVMAGDHDGAKAAARQAAEIGARFGDRDLAVFARNLEGRALLAQGKVGEGLPLLDEVMLSATRGELSPLVTPLVYCGVIASCQRVYALDRSREWTAALATWCDAHPELVLFTGTCRVHRAEVFRLGGAWSEAFAEARLACERRNGFVDPEAGGQAFYEQGELHRLRGAFEAAEEAYRSANELGREPQPGLALLRLAQGRVDAATASIRRVLGGATDLLSRACLLPAWVHIAVAAGARDEARQASEELTRIAEQFGTELLAALAAQASGDVAFAEGRAEAAVAPLRRALGIFRELGAPYDEARVRTSLASVCAALCDEDAASLERGAAREIFARLGAAPDLAALESPGDRSARAAPCRLTARELEVLRLVATGKTNKAIAQALFLSEKTVDRHVSNIFDKLDVPSRAAATAYAYENKLL
jgi:ATP/maltotriose-dependent transcriptional regulator MalT